MLSPGIQLLLRDLRDQIAFGQLEIRAEQGGFTLRNASDSNAPATALRAIPPAEMRGLALFTREGNFRPLRTAPDLASGWMCSVANEQELEHALQMVYPGALPDWHAVQTGFARVTHFPAFASRQTGIYATLPSLTEEEAEKVTAACCASSGCIKQRFWTVTGGKSVEEPNPLRIPCLEPCAVFMEFARQSERWLKQSCVTLHVTPVELETLRSALEHVEAHSTERQARFADPLNVRRTLLCLERQSGKLKHNKSKKGKEENVNEVL
ncbi:MAG TPA: DR2241 family protein [Methylomirabilota bacterium]|nr:DR2241 family protein [Methylomirabilota bacterium]